MARDAPDISTAAIGESGVGGGRGEGIAPWRGEPHARLTEDEEGQPVHPRQIGTSDVKVTPMVFRDRALKGRGFSVPRSAPA